MLKKRINNNHGMALAVLLMVFAVIIIFGVTALSLSVSQTKQSVSSEDYTEAYYIARSATDAVSTDIINSIKELNANMIDEESDEGEVANYNALFAKTKKMLSTGNVIVNGIGSGPVTSNVVVTEPVPDEYVVTVETVYTQQDRTGRAKVMLGKITSSIETLTIEGNNDYAIYAWGDLFMGNNFSLTGGDKIAYGDGLFSENNGKPLNVTIIGNATVEKDPAIPVFIIAPPDSVISTNKTASKDLLIKNGGMRDIKSTDSGYYGVIDTNKGPINWVVDTENGKDVTIIVNQLLVDNNHASITVKGTGKFYLYLMEDPTKNDSSKQLMYFKNNLEIDGVDDEGLPQTYIISYTKKMQQLYDPTKEINKITNDQIGTYDTAEIKNNLTGDAFLYLPGINLTTKNNEGFTGSIYVSEFHLKNNGGVHFKPYSDGVLVNKTELGDVSFTVEKVGIEGGLNNLNKVWIK